MSITIHIYYSSTNHQARAFAQEMIESGVVDKIRSAKGNLQYDYFYPIDDEETVLLIDRWENQEALDRHHDSSCMQDILKLREKYDLRMKVERYVSDEAGIPEKDQSFIKE